MLIQQQLLKFCWLQPFQLFSPYCQSSKVCVLIIEPTTPSVTKLLQSTQWIIATKLLIGLALTYLETSKPRMNNCGFLREIQYWGSDRSKQNPIPIPRKCYPDHSIFSQSHFLNKHNVTKQLLNKNAHCVLKAIRYILRDLYDNLVTATSSFAVPWII